MIGQIGNTMNYQWYRSSRAVSSLVMLVTCNITTQLHANDVYTGVDGDAHAMGVVLLRVTFPSRGEVWSVRLGTSRDGKEFREAGIGLPRAYQLFRSISYHEGTTTVLVPAIAWFRTGRFFFDEPGRYWFRWGIAFRDQDKPRTVRDQRDFDIEAVVVDQVVEVGVPTRADLDFISGLADEDLARYIFGADFFERQTGDAIQHIADPEVRAVGVIGRLLYATRGRSPETAIGLAGPKGDVGKAADSLITLAKEIPDSSYAPYAAYYAGCCYAAIGTNTVIETIRARRVRGQRKDRAAEAELRYSLAEKHRDFAKARAAFAVAAERGDAYLKPRALYQQGFLRIFAGALDQGEKLLDRALEAGGEEGTIRTMVDELRGQMARAKGAMSQRKRNGND